MGKKDFPVTTAIRELKKLKIDFVPHVYEYEEKGGTAQTAIELDVSEHNVIKTIVVALNTNELVICLMHGDLEVSMKELARQLKVKSAEPASPKIAQNATGYQFGGTSPLGTRKKLKVYAEETIFELDKIYINGGKRGFILEMLPDELNKLDVVKVKVGISR